MNMQCLLPCKHSTSGNLLPYQTRPPDSSVKRVYPNSLPIDHNNSISECDNSLMNQDP